jgi:hypothetical protein
MLTIPAQTCVKSVVVLQVAGRMVYTAYGQTDLFGRFLCIEYRLLSVPDPLGNTAFFAIQIAYD